MADIRRARVLLVCVGSLMALGLLAGCDSDDKRPAAPVIDTIPPAIPDGLAGSYQSGGVLLAWDANVTDPDLAGYMIYRSTQHDSGYSPLTSVPVTTNSWVDDTTERGHSYYYRVAAVDAAGNESGLSFNSLVTIPGGLSNRHDQVGHN